MKKQKAQGLTFKNRKATHDYFILEKIETGIVLLGTEIKSIRNGNINLKESYAAIEDFELFLLNCHINPYECGNIANHEPLRKRKLLVHKKEIKKLIDKTQVKGLSLIPLKMYFKKGILKLELGIGKGKKLFDKRETIKQKTSEREVQRQLRNITK